MKISVKRRPSGFDSSVLGCLALAGSLLLSACGGDGAKSTGPIAPPPPPSATYTIGGSVSGLSGSLVLQNNGGDNLAVSASGGFVFSAAATSGTSYAVAVLTQPDGQICTVKDGSGTVTGNVTNVAVSCVALPPGSFSIGGAVTGLSGSVVLQNNRSDNLTINANGNFTFSAPVVAGASFEVAVLTQPAGQTCAVENGSGTVGANITNVAVSCVALPPGSFSIGGTVTDLSGSVVLQNNGGDNLTVSASGNFTFGVAVTSGAPYAVSVLTQPSGQTCEVQNGSGTAAANVTNVAVSCVALPPAMLSLSSSTPEDGAMDVARDVQPLAVFSAALDAATVTSTNFELNDGGGAVSVDYQVAGAQATVLPQRKLKPLTQYTLTAGTGVRGLGGEILPAAVTLQFTTRDRSWGKAQLIESGTGTAGVPDVAADGAGNVFAVWVQSDGTRSNVWANRYVTRTGWGAAQLIETEDSGNAADPQVAVDVDGNAFVVWEQSGGTGSVPSIWVNRYTAGSGWGMAGPLETDDSEGASDPQVAINASGNAVAVWRRSFPSLRRNIVASYFTKATGLWSAEQLIETEDSGTASDPQVAIDVNGNAVAVWTLSESTGGSSIWASHYSAARASWLMYGPIETVVFSGGVTADASNARVAMDASGNAIAVWQVFDGARYNIGGNRFVASTRTWGRGDQTIESEAGDANFPHVAMRADGSAVAVWEQFDGTRYNAWSAHYQRGTGWGAPQLIEGEQGDAFGAQVAVDADGSAVAVWAHQGATNLDIWSARYAANTGWSAQKAIGSGDRDAFSPQVAIDGNGDTVVVWMNQLPTGSIDIHSNRFD